MSDSYYHLSELQRELDGYERGGQMDRLEAENQRLRQEIVELKLEISRLGGRS